MHKVEVSPKNSVYMDNSDKNLYPCGALEDGVLKSHSLDKAPPSSSRNFVHEDAAEIPSKGASRACLAIISLCLAIPFVISGLVCFDTGVHRAISLLSSQFVMMGIPGDQVVGTLRAIRMGTLVPLSIVFGSFGIAVYAGLALLAAAFLFSRRRPRGALSSLLRNHTYWAPVCSTLLSLVLVLLLVLAMIMGIWLAASVALDRTSSAAVNFLGQPKHNVQVMEYVRSDLVNMLNITWPSIRDEFHPETRTLLDPLVDRYITQPAMYPPGCPVGCINLLALPVNLNQFSCICDKRPLNQLHERAEFSIRLLIRSVVGLFLMMIGTVMLLRFLASLARLPRLRHYEG